MEIVSKISEKDYVSAVLTMLWTRRSIKICTIIFILLFVFNFFTVAVLKTTDAVTLLFPLIFLSVFLGSIYLGAKKTFKSDRRISEKIRYVFEDTEFNVYGESFSSTLSWDKVHKVTQTKKWLLVWQNNILANIIPMTSLDESRLDYLRDVLNTNNVPHKI